MAGIDDQITVGNNVNKNLAQIVQAINAKFPNWIAVPATATSPGVPGQVAYDNTHFYLCTQSNVWVRATLSTF